MSWNIQSKSAVYSRILSGQTESRKKLHAPVSASAFLVTITGKAKFIRDNGLGEFMISGPFI